MSDYTECIQRQSAGAEESCDPYSECEKFGWNPETGCDIGVDLPSSPVLRYAALPYAPYPPGGAPTSGSAKLRLSPNQFADLYRKSDCYKCQVRINVRQASKLTFGWKFWVGIGAGALGAMTLIATKNR